MLLTTDKTTISSPATSFYDDLQVVRNKMHQSPETAKTASSIQGSTSTSNLTAPSSCATRSDISAESPMLLERSRPHAVSTELVLAQDFAEHVRQKREAFAAKLIRLESFVGEFKPGWIEERLEYLEQIWMTEFERGLQNAQPIAASDSSSKLATSRSRPSFGCGGRFAKTARQAESESPEMFHVNEIKLEDNGLVAGANVEVQSKKEMCKGDLATPKPTSKLPVPTSRPSSTCFTST